MDTRKNWIWHLQPFQKPKNCKKIPGLQNILREEMMAIHHTLQLLTTTYHNEPTHIFTDCLNVLYLLNTQIKHPTSHNSHPNKIIIENMVSLLISRTQTTTLHKIKAHTNIGGNDLADALAKHERELDHRDVAAPHEHAHPTPYYISTKRLVALHARNT
jgi:ribonuclease HI